MVEIISKIDILDNFDDKKYYVAWILKKQETTISCVK